MEAAPHLLEGDGACGFAFSFCLEHEYLSKSLWPDGDSGPVKLMSKPSESERLLPITQVLPGAHVLGPS